MGILAKVDEQLQVELIKKAALVSTNFQSVSSQSSWLSWWPIRESYTGAWQANVTVDAQPNLLAFSAVFACVTGIASDVAKMRIKLSRNNEGIWEEITESHGNSEASKYIPVLKKPNHYQTRIEFLEQWIVSKLLYGNAYILKEREGGPRTPVTALYVLDPRRVHVLVSPDGGVYYDLSSDDLSKVEEHEIVPASEIIHDRMVALWHPLVGVSPLYACSISTTMGNKIQANSTNVFANGARPGGIVTVPGPITNEQAIDIKARFEAGYAGSNIGKTAVLADGMTFSPIEYMTAEIMQLIEQLRWTVEDVARAFRYPHWMLGGPMPPYTKPDLAMTAYYSTCLHPHIEKVELCLDEGLELPPLSKLGTELDLDGLMRMDTEALYESNNKARGWMKLDEQRNRANLKPLKTGGDTVYLQQQDFSVEALAKRDAQPDPFAKNSPTSESAPSPAPTPVPEPTKDIVDMTIKAIEDALREELQLT